MQILVQMDAFLVYVGLVDPGLLQGVVVGVVGYPFAVGSSVVDRGLIWFHFHRLTSFLIFTHIVEETVKQKDFPPPYDGRKYLFVPSTS